MSPRDGTPVKRGMMKYFEAKLGQSSFAKQTRSYRYNVEPFLVTEDELCGIVTKLYITPSGYPSGDPTRYEKCVEWSDTEKSVDYYMKKLTS